MDVDSRDNLIAANHTLEEMTGMLGVDSLGFLSVEGVKKIAEGCTCGLCTGCFTGDYPPPVPKAPWARTSLNTSFRRATTERLL